MSGRASPNPGMLPAPIQHAASPSRRLDSRQRRPIGEVFPRRAVPPYPRPRHTGNLPRPCLVAPHRGTLTYSFLGRGGPLGPDVRSPLPGLRPYSLWTSCSPRALRPARSPQSALHGRYDRPDFSPAFAATTTISHFSAGVFQFQPSALPGPRSRNLPLAEERLRLSVRGGS